MARTSATGGNTRAILFMSAMLGSFALLFFLMRPATSSQHHLIAAPSLGEIQDLGSVHSNKVIRGAAERARVLIEQQSNLRDSFPVAAILVSTKGRVHHEKLLAQELLSLPFIREVVLWQDGGALNTELQTLVDKLNGGAAPKTVTFHHSTKQLFEEAKYHACAQHTKDTTKVCFFQGTWYSSYGYIATLYANFLRAPTLLHAAVDPVTYYHDTELRFFHDKSIHAGFANMKFGSMFLKSTSADFVAEQARRKSEPEVFADSYFTLWLNQPPVLLCNRIDKFERGLGSVSVKHRNSYQRRQEKEQRSAELQSLSQLISLRTDQTVTTGVRTRPDGLASCSDDRCLLISNMIAMDPPPVMHRAADMVPQFSKLIEGDCNRPAHLESEKCVPFEARRFAMLSYHHAVDRNTATIWVSHENVTAGSYFGLDLVRMRKNVANVTVIAAHPFQHLLGMQVSMDGVKFIDLQIEPSVRKLGTYHQGHLSYTEFIYPLMETLSTLWINAIKSKSEVHTLPPLYVRYLRFVSPQDMHAPFAVSEIDIDHVFDDPSDSTVQEELRVLEEEQMWVDR